jgi:hypothetical protein
MSFDIVDTLSLGVHIPAAFKRIAELRSIRRDATSGDLDIQQYAQTPEPTVARYEPRQNAAARSDLSRKRSAEMRARLRGVAASTPPPAEDNTRYNGMRPKASNRSVTGDLSDLSGDLSRALDQDFGLAQTIRSSLSLRALR